MSEDVTAKLARFTPTGLDRDAVLFAAGKASGRRGVWKWLALALIGTNAVTLAALAWQKSSPVVLTEPTGSPVVPNVSADEPYGPLAASSYLGLMQALDADAVPPPTDGSSSPSRPLTPRSWDDPRFN
jgi:hypothetical protein